MIELLPSPDHVVAVRIGGTMTGADFDQVTEAVEAALGRHARIGVLVDLRGFTDATLEAAIKDTRYDLSKMFQLRRFPREAVVTDKRWMHTLAQFASPLMPFVELRTFEVAQFEAAMAWVSDLDPSA